MLEIIPFILGPVETNAYLVADPQSSEAAVIDPAWDGELIAREAVRRGWQIRQVWLTHAHFDHMAGTAGLARSVQPAPEIALHFADLPMYHMRGGAALFGFQISPGPEPTLDLKTKAALKIGEVACEVRHAPGHTPGHVVFYAAKEGVAFCGDVIFFGSIGRTDLPGGDYKVLMLSITTQILSLPDETRLLPGHGSETTVGAERRSNPFLTDMGIG
jgi:hydroxyacylglutathione hydrolase